MKRPFQLSTRTVVGRKNIEALSGTLLLGFMVEHTLANALLLLTDPAPYHWYVEFMGRWLLVRGLEVALFALFAVHISLGIAIRWQHRRIRQRRQSPQKDLPLSTRSIGWTGGVILIFLIIHLRTFFVPHRLQEVHGFDLYHEAHVAFASVWYTLFYVLAMVSLGMHLYHGIRSAVFSFTMIPRHLVPRVRVVLSWVGAMTSALLGLIAVVLFLRSL